MSYLLSIVLNSNPQTLKRMRLAWPLCKDDMQTGDVHIFKKHLPWKINLNTEMVLKL